MEWYTTKSSPQQPLTTNGICEYPKTFGSVALHLGKYPSSADRCKFYTWLYIIFLSRGLKHVKLTFGHDSRVYFTLSILLALPLEYSINSRCITKRQFNTYISFKYDLSKSNASNFEECSVATKYSDTVNQHCAITREMIKHRCQGLKNSQWIFSYCSESNIATIQTETENVFDENFRFLNCWIFFIHGLGSQRKLSGEMLEL